MKATTISLLIMSLCLAYIVNTQGLIENCQSYTNPYICQSCSAGKNCCTPNCGTCINQVKCAQCLPSYNLDPNTGVCYPANSCAPQVGCVICASNNTCSSCGAGYYANQFTYECQPCQANCDVCSSASNCTMCLDGYYLNPKGECAPCVDNCLTCKNSNTCSLCEPGYITNSSSLCQSCPANCDTCTSPTTCTICFTGFYINANNQCSPCSQNCKACQGTSYNCTDCYEGFNALNGTCVNCSFVFPNCSSCSVDNTTMFCNTCLDGFYLYHQAQCLSCISDCQQCIGPNTCSKCLPTLYFNTITNACTSCPQANCLDCGNGTACTNCPVGYFVNNPTGTCQLCGQGCDSCSGIGACMDCSDEYYNHNGLCYPCSEECSQCVGGSYNCTICKEGYYRTTGLGVCFPCPKYCPDCQDPDTCNSCPPGSYLSSGICQQCTTSHCFDCQTLGSNTCSLCSLGYYLSDKNQCQRCGPSCDICQNNTICSSCSIGFYLTPQGACIPCQKNCDICDAADCTSCSIGYFPDKNNNCVSCPNGCSSCHNVTLCTECKTGFYLQTVNGAPTGSCSPCAQQCRTCTDNSNTCTSCVSGSYLSSSGICSPCDEGCLLCNDVFGCLACSFNYLRIYEINTTEYYTCQKCQTNCLRCSMQTKDGINTLPCSQCIFGYTALSDGSCFPCGSTPQTNGCQVCNPDKTCMNCLPGLILNEGKCTAQQLTNRSPAGFFIVVIVILSVACAGLIGLAIYWQCTKKEQTSLYNQIA